MSDPQRRINQPGWESTRGENNRNARLTEADVRFIRKSKLTVTKLAKMFGVSPTTIIDVKKFKRWKHVQDESE